MRSRLLALVLLVAAPVPAALAQRAASPASPAQVLDPAVRTGRLANGLTYYVRRNTEPRNRAELYLAVNAGSAMEDNDQRGLAHLLEHMLFNGTERFPKQDLVRYLESTGMRFGGDVNAYTSFDETVYTLTVPTDSARMFNHAFDVLRDWAGSATLDPDEINRERGVVIEEWRVRDQNAGGRIRAQTVPALLPGSRYALRIPIGDTAVIRRAPASALQRFYRDWYRPNLMAVIVVGDVDVAATEARIQQEFSSLRNPATPRPRPTLPAPTSTGARYLAVTDAEFPATLVQVVSMKPATPSKTEADGRADLVDALVANMLNQRLDELRRSPDAPFVGAGVGTGSLVRPADQFSMTVQLDPDRIEDGYAALLREAERARRHGFTEGELARQKADLLRQYQTAYNERERTPSARLAQGLLDYFLTGAVAQSAEADYRLVERLLPTISLADVNAEGRRILAPRSRLVTFLGTDRPGVAEPTTTSLRTLDQRLAARIRRETITPYEDRPVADALMATLPTPGTFANATTYDNLGVTAFTLGNGMKVVVKPTAFKADEVNFTMTSPGGASQVADADAFAAGIAATVAARSGAGALGQTALEAYLAGKAVQVAPYIGATDEGFNGTASPQDLETAFQLLYQYAAAPRFDAGTFEAFRLGMRAALANASATPQGVLQDSLTLALDQPGPRVMTAAQRLAALDAVTLADLERIYRDRFADFSEATLTLVGNIDVPTAQRLAQQYLATLPTTSRVEAVDVDALPRRRTDNVDVKVYKGVAPQSQVVMIYQGEAATTQEAQQRMEALANVLSIRLREKIREELSGVYGVQVQGSISERPRPEYQFLVYFACDPQRVDELSAAVRAEIQKIATDGPSVEEVAASKAQQHRERQAALEQNRFWMNALDEAFAWPTGKPGEIVDGYDALVDATSGARIREDAQTYLGANARTVRVVVLPDTMRPTD